MHFGFYWRLEERCCKVHLIRSASNSERTGLNGHAQTPSKSQRTQMNYKLCTDVFPSTGSCVCVSLISAGEYVVLAPHTDTEYTCFASALAYNCALLPALSDDACAQNHEQSAMPSVHTTQTIKPTANQHRTHANPPPPTLRIIYIKPHVTHITRTPESTHTRANVISHRLSCSIGHLFKYAQARARTRASQRRLSWRVFYVTEATEASSLSFVRLRQCGGRQCNICMVNVRIYLHV